MRLLPACPTARWLPTDRSPPWAGYPGRARQVGFALAGMPVEWDLPWHRIINAQGKVSPRSGSNHLVQYELLASEGVVFTAQRIDLKRFGWRPEAED